MYFVGINRNVINASKLNLLLNISLLIYSSGANPPDTNGVSHGVKSQSSIIYNFISYFDSPDCGLVLVLTSSLTNSLSDTWFPLTATRTKSTKDSYIPLYRVQRRGQHLSSITIYP